MEFPCTRSVKCPGSDSPISNWSSEDPDLLRFRTAKWPIYNANNPVGGTDGTGVWPGWLAAGCLSFCSSSTSPSDVVLCAQRQAFICAHTKDDGTTPEFFYNSFQQCSYTCPDGTLFTWNVSPGTFIDLTQGAADQRAHDYACLQAALNHVCMGDFQTSGCIGVKYSSTITLMGHTPIGTELIGSLPDGLNLSENPTGTTATISGTPTTGGLFTFSLLATDVNGNTHMKSFTIGILAISNILSIPDATENTAYSFAFAGVGGKEPYVFEITAGVLPSGLTMDSSGQFHGGPDYTTAGLYPLTVKITDANGNTCKQDGDLKVNLRPGPDWTQLVWTTYNVDGGGGANTASGSAAGNFAFGSLHKDGGAIFPKISPVAASGVTYSGPAVTARFIVTVSDSGAALATLSLRLFRNGVIIGVYAQPFTTGVFNFDIAIPLSVGAVFTIDDASPGNAFAQLVGVGSAGDLTFSVRIINL